MPTDQAFNQAFDEAIRHTQQGRLEDAAAAWQRAAGHAPERPDVHYNLGNALKKLGRSEDAAEAYRRAVDLEPGLANAYFNLGGVLKDLARLIEAADAYRGAIGADPGDAEAHMNLGNTLDLLGDGEAAEQSLRQSCALDPGSAAAHFNLANVLRKSGRPGAADEAEACYRRTLALSPGMPEAHDCLGRILLERGDLAGAREQYRKAIQLNAGFAAAHANLATVYRKTGQLDEAEASCRRAIKLDADLAGAHDVLGNVHMAQGKIFEAAACFRRAIALDENLAEAHSDLGNALTDLRDLDGALASYQTAMQLTADAADSGKPALGDAGKNTLITLLYQPGLSNKELFERYRGAVPSPGKSPEHPPAPAAPHKPGDRLRIGYVSSDFRFHPVGNNVLPLLANHDHDRVEVFCYAHVMAADEVTETFRNHADHWRPVTTMTDAEVAGAMRADGIQVAVFLGGHFDENRPGAAAFGSAPVQAAMHGGSTTALDAMDYWFSDDVLHPEDEGAGAERFTETLVRLPNFYAFTPPPEAPDVSALPADGNGFVTFVSFNKPCKMNDGVLDVWSGVLKAVPESRLILKFRNHLGDAALAGPMLARLEANGIGAGRIEMAAALDGIGDHLAHYHRGDIALDPFPFSGATTTFQALWMGLPVISLYGERFIGRMAASISHHAGLSDLAAATPAEYVDAAAALAADRDRLRDLRSGLRQQLKASPLCDGRAYARNVEDALQAMWEKAGAKGG